MLKKDVAIGKNYVTNQGNKVRVLEEVVREPFRTNNYGRNHKTTTHWIVLNLKTGRKNEIKSAARFKREAHPFELS